MTGDDDDDDRPDQTRTNTKRMDHAICDDLAAVVVPGESCRPPRVHCHSCDHEDRFPINPTGPCARLQHHVAQAAAAAQGLTERPSTRSPPAAMPVLPAPASRPL